MLAWSCMISTAECHPMWEVWLNHKVLTLAVSLPGSQMNLRESGDLRSQGQCVLIMRPVLTSVAWCLNTNISAFPTFLQLPFTWVSKSVRAQGRRTWLGSERRWAAGPCGGGTGSTGGGARMWLPGPPCWPLSAILYTRCGRRSRGFRGWGVPSLHRQLWDF